MVLQPTEVIIMIGVVYAVFSVYMQRRLSNVDKMYALRARMNKKSKELMAMAKANVPREQMMEHQKELTSVSMESMKNQMKPMIVILPVLLALEYAVLPGMFPQSTTFSVLGFTLGYQMFFIVVIFIVGIVLSVSLSIYDRRRLKDKYNFGLLQPTAKEPAQEGTEIVR
ncbi:MAG: EMC3/TMCO1 family protein [Candidatus Marsarchaeota archaeon]|nr:EMC3/TMCO1 family protein [Candidatus Marsarchaeota archaeon]